MAYEDWGIYPANDIDDQGLAEPGIYKAEVKSAELRRSNAGDPMVNVHLVDVDTRRTLCFDNLMSPETTRPARGDFRHQCEYIVWGTKGVTTPATWGGPWPGCFQIPVKQADKHHMTGKPTALMSELVECCPPGGTVLDPFMGSGTTLVAAKNKGRNAIGIEMSPHYCQVASNRLLQRSLFAPPAEAEPEQTTIEGMEGEDV